MRTRTIFVAIGALSAIGVAATVTLTKRELIPVAPDDAYLTKEIGAAYPGFIGQEAAFATSMAGIMADHRAGDRKNAREGYEQWSEERRSSELREEAKWEQVQSTPCADFGVGDAPQLCIEYMGLPTIAIGTPVKYRVRWRNLPAGAYIRVWSRNAAHAGERWKYMGAYGAVAPGTLGGKASGDERVSWDGRSIYCAPADAPMMCDKGEVGRYVLRAAIMTGSDPFWPSWPARNPVTVARHARSETDPFTLDGPPQPVAIKGQYRTHPYRRDIVETLSKALPEGTVTNSYVERRVDRLGPWQRGVFAYCARLALDAPVSGSLDLCFTRRKRDANGIALAPGDFTASGDARLSPGILGAKTAKTMATAYAIGLTNRQATYPAYPAESDMVRTLFRDVKLYDGGYQDLRNAARDARLTYVEVNQPWATFRTDDRESWWLVEAGLWINTIDGPTTRDFGRISLRVDHDGRVCRVEPTGKTEGEGPDRQNRYTACIPGSQRRIELTK
ncbi:MAG: hypothetical protein ACT6R2_03355 [Blastomonas fulva]|uniref:hypothetical protein n=1 Tax=Alphaproteobacteria TaxID=28211 RepID=UPI00403316B7